MSAMLPHIKVACDAVAAGRRLSDHQAFAHFMFQGIKECQDMTDQGGWERRRCYRVFNLVEGAHSDNIETIRAKLRHDRRLMKAGRDSLFSNSGRWWLAGALIAEGRLNRSARAIAKRFAMEVA